MSRIIGLVGKMGSGKDTAARALTTRAWARVGFADALKDLAMYTNPTICPTKGFNVTLRMLVGEHGWDTAKSVYPGIRKYLQDLGVGVRDFVGDHAWIHAARQRMMYKQGDIVVTDCRFLNEAAAIRSWGGSVVRIIRSEPAEGKIDKMFNDLMAAELHVSETELDGIRPDITIVNDGTIEELQAKLLAYSETLKPLPSPMV